MGVYAACHEMFNELKNNTDKVVAVGVKNSSTLVVYVTSLDVEVKSILPLTYKGYFIETEITDEFTLH